MGPINGSPFSPTLSFLKLEQSILAVAIGGNSFATVSLVNFSTILLSCKVWNISHKHNSASPIVLQRGPGVSDMITVSGVSTDDLLPFSASSSDSTVITLLLFTVRHLPRCPNFSASSGEDHSYNHLFTETDFFLILKNNFETQEEISRNFH